MTIDRHDLNTPSELRAIEADVRSLGATERAGLPTDTIERIASQSSVFLSPAHDTGVIGRIGFAPALRVAAAVAIVGLGGAALLIGTRSGSGTGSPTATGIAATAGGTGEQGVPEAGLVEATLGTLASIDMAMGSDTFDSMLAEAEGYAQAISSDPMGLSDLPSIKGAM